MSDLNSDTHAKLFHMLPTYTSIHAEACGFIFNIHHKTFHVFVFCFFLFSIQWMYCLQPTGCF